MKICKARDYRGFEEYAATAELGQFSASVYANHPLAAGIKAAWNVHVYAIARKTGLFDPFYWMFK